MSDPSSGADRSDAAGKVGRIMEKYDLAGLCRELEARWNGDGYERSSLRELADYFNRRVLEAAMVSAGIHVSSSERDHVYEVLTESDVDSGSRVRKRRELEREGLDVEAVEADFVSHQSMHTYLRDHRGIEYEGPSETDRHASAVETLQRLQTRVSKVTSRTVDSLANADELTVGSFQVSVSVRVHCQDCGRGYDVVELLDAGGCNCDSG